MRHFSKRLWWCWLSATVAAFAIFVAPRPWSRLLLGYVVGCAAVSMVAIWRDTHRELAQFDGSERQLGTSDKGPS